MTVSMTASTDISMITELLCTYKMRNFRQEKTPPREWLLRLGGAVAAA
jgi:hypothetical protein